MAVTRRELLCGGALAVFASACAPGVLLDPGLRRREARGAPLLVAIFLRGGADALHVAPPLQDPDLARLRGPLAVGEPLPLGRDLGLHPALAPLRPVLDRRELALVVCTGLPLDTRSHFDAQDFMESGRPGVHRLRDGWLARAFRGHARAHPFETLALTPGVPLSLRGSETFAIPAPHYFGLGTASPASRRALWQTYELAPPDALVEAGRAGLRALGEFEAVRDRALRAGDLRERGSALEAQASRLLALERAGLGVRAAFLEHHGWDTHRGQGAERGALAESIAQLARAIAALAGGLRERRELQLVTLTEFGRTVRANGSQGTDHGRGSFTFVVGPGVRGGVYGEWRGLSVQALHEDRELPVTTDSRSVLHEVLTAHLGAAPPPDTFPDFAPSPPGVMDPRG